MVAVSANFARDGYYFSQVQIVCGRSILPKSIPRCHAVHANLSASCFLFQSREGPPKPVVKCAAGDFTQLLLRVVDVKDIDGFDTQVATRTLELILQIPGGYAVHSANQFFPRNDA